MEHLLRQLLTWIVSLAVVLVYGLFSLAQTTIELARVHLKQAWDALANDLEARRRNILDRVGIVIIKFFNDSWQIYMGTLTHRQLLWNALYNFRNAFLGPIE
jgi:hypothetical protein